jgi:hypothetical protein
MSDDLVNQLTLNFLISKQQLQKLNKKVKETSDQRKIRETQEYIDRIKTLFSDLLVCQPPDDLLFEVKTAFDTFIEKSIYYFKAHDNSENLEKERCEQIHEDFDYEKEEREIENGNYKERSNDSEEELEDGYNDDNDDNEDDNEQDEEHEEKEHEEKEHEKEEEKYNIIEEQTKIKITNKTINHTPIVVTSKYKKLTKSDGVDDIQRLPLDWFENVRQNYKKNQIIPRKKEPSIIEPTFRDFKKKI